MKQPKWVHLTYAEVEEARKTLGLPKTKMARLLGVTNSTYHNWKRGQAVPHPHRQQSIRRSIDAALIRAGRGETISVGSGTIDGFRAVVPDMARSGASNVHRLGDASALCDLLVAYTRTHPEQVTVHSLPALVRDLVHALYD